MKNIESWLSSWRGENKKEPPSPHFGKTVQAPQNKNRSFLLLAFLISPKKGLEPSYGMRLICAIFKRNCSF
jgi:hypothetical protein